MSGAPSSPAGPSRRTVLGAVGSALLLAACSAPVSAPAPSSGTAAPPYTIDQLLAQVPFLIAHRGSGDTWTEHTMDAYRRSVDAGAMALEISVHATKDGVLVCHHDGNTKRMTGTDLEIAETTWAELSTLPNDARAWLGPAAALQPIPRLADVLDAFIDTHVLFVEDKSGKNPRQVLDMVLSHPTARERVIWKQHAGAPNLALAKSRGLKSWGYFTTDELDVFDEYQGRFDLIGMIVQADDRAFERAVATGKPVIAWEVHRRSERERLEKLGVRGLMCSNYPYVARTFKPAAQDAFASGLRAAGDLPQNVGGDWTDQPLLLPKERACRFDQKMPSSYVLGSMTLDDRPIYSIQWQLSWPDAMPGARDHAGVAFGQDTDEPYRPLEVSAASGYHVLFRANGEGGLYRRAAGVRSGELLGDFRSPAPKPGEWVSFVIEVTRTTVVFRRLGNDAWSAGARDETYRGDYLSLYKNYAGTVPVEFRDVRIA
ncbi:glycerophosphodiester phosphodiesterase [Tersicoccus sp. MR15.9]|uniref:glycerophosphodiester phosphodiesterase n=1 Tax=Tersicoccus mangrovi TaxID=3121635 RepID=UPI002FE6A041